MRRHFSFFKRYQEEKKNNFKTRHLSAAQKSSWFFGKICISSFSHHLQWEQLKTTRKISLVTRVPIWKSTPVSAPRCSSFFLRPLKLWFDITTAHMRFQKGISQRQPSWKQAAPSLCATQISQLFQPPWRYLPVRPHGWDLFFKFTV